MTRREFSIDFFGFVFMAFFFASIFVAPFVCAWHYMDRAMSNAGNTAPSQETKYPLAVLGEPEAAAPTATNREAGAVPQAGRATPCCASCASVSVTSERSESRASSPRFGAVLVDRTHGVRRVLEPGVRSLLKTAPGLARSSSGIRGEAPMVSAQGNLADSLKLKRPVGSLPTRNVENGVTLERDPGFASCSLTALGALKYRAGRCESEPHRGSSLQGGLYEVTAYSHGCTMPRSGRERPAQRGADGRWPIPELTVAADTSLHPFGTEVLIEGLGFRQVGDRGHAIKGRRLDLFVGSCEAAREFGRRWLSVTVVPAETTRWASR